MSMRHADIEAIIQKTQKEWLEDVGQKSVTEAMKQIKEHYRNLTDADLAKLRERIEELESRASSPGKTAGKARTAPGVKIHHVGSEKVYELAPHVKMADVIVPAIEPPVSLARWMGAAVLGERCGDKAALEYARELKTLTGGTTGLQIPTQHVPEWIDNLRSFMVLNAAGVVTVTMTERTQTHSRVLQDPNVAWRAEGGALTASDPTFELRQLVAKSVYTRVQGSVELAADSPSFGEQLMVVMARALGSEIDRAGLRGLGASNEPQGVLGADGVNTLISVGSITNFDKFVDAIALLWSANVPEDRVGPFAVSPSTLKKVRKLKTGISGDQTTLSPPPGLPRFLVSTSMEDNNSPATSTAIVGDWADLLFGVRQEAGVEVLRLQSYADNLLLEYVGWARCDFLIRRPKSFTTMTGIAN